MKNELLKKLSLKMAELSVSKNRTMEQTKWGDSLCLVTLDNS